MAGSEREQSKNLDEAVMRLWDRSQNLARQIMVCRQDLAELDADHKKLKKEIYDLYQSKGQPDGTNPSDL